MPMSRGRRGVWVVGSLLAAAAIVALVFADPRTFRHVLDDFLTVLAGPLHPGWWQVRTTSPIRRTLVGVALQLLPVVLVPAFVVRPGRLAAAASAGGTVLWLVSGSLMLALHYVD